MPGPLLTSIRLHHCFWEYPRINLCTCSYRSVVENTFFALSFLGCRCSRQKIYPYDKILEKRINEVRCINIFFIRLSDYLLTHVWLIFKSTWQNSNTEGSGYQTCSTIKPLSVSTNMNSKQKQQCKLNPATFFWSLQIKPSKSYQGNDISSKNASVISLQHSEIITVTDEVFMCVSAGDSSTSQSALAASLFLASDGLMCICVYSLIHPFIYSFIHIFFTVTISIVIESIATHTVCILKRGPFQPSKPTTSSDYDFFGQKEHSKHTQIPFKVNWTETTWEHVHASLQEVI